MTQPKKIPIPTVDCSSLFSKKFKGPLSCPPPHFNFELFFILIICATLVLQCALGYEVSAIPNQIGGWINDHLLTFKFRTFLPSSLVLHCAVGPDVSAATNSKILCF